MRWHCVSLIILDKFSYKVGSLLCGLGVLYTLPATSLHPEFQIVSIVMDISIDLFSGNKCYYVLQHRQKHQMYTADGM